MNLTFANHKEYDARQVLKTPKQKRHIASDNVVFLRPLFQWSGVRLIQQRGNPRICPPTSAGFERPTACISHPVNSLKKEQKTMSKPIKVPFHGATLYVVDHNGEPYTPLKPIVEGIGLDWARQYRKVTADMVRWGIAVKAIPSRGGKQEAACIPLRKLAGWLMTLHPSRVKPELRDKITAYQNECDDALWKYWSEGTAERRAKPGALKSAPQPVPQARAALPAITSELQTRINKRAWELAHAAYDDYRKRMMDDVLVKSGSTQPEAWPDGWTPLENSQDVIEHIFCAAKLLEAHANSINIRGRRLAEMVGKDYVKATARFRPGKDEK